MKGRNGEEEVFRVHCNTLCRSANYQPSSWRYERIQSISSEYGKESYVEERDGLREQVRMMISQLTNDLEKLEFIDLLQKLGVSDHFVIEIRNILQHVNAKSNHMLKTKNNLHRSALQFRILRQHGYDVSSDVFKSFQDDKRNFVWDDIKGILSLYEASFHSMEGETILEEARDFCSIHLKQFLKENQQDSEMSIMISHALELPLHWRIPRLEAPWFIDLYQRRNDVNLSLLKFARLDFNLVQVTHQQDLKYTSRWWKEVGLGGKLTFARDMPTENFFWGLGMASQPELSYFRREMTKITSFITIIDDIYDAYGTLQELELFTHVVHRWDLHAMDILPSYMKICFLALYNSVNEVAFAILKHTGFNINPFLKKAWGDLCQSYLIEAKWYYNGHVPSMQEYLENSWISVGGPVALVQGYFLIHHDYSVIRPQDFQYLQDQQEYPNNIIRLSSTIVRLANDLASYKIGGNRDDDDVPKSLKCYMNETGTSEEEAYEYVHTLMCQTWKKVNEAVHDSAFSPSFTEIAMNLARMAQYMYQHGDGHGEDSHINLRMISLLGHPIPIISTNY
ncbi:myrcene synthase, chloroplastic-like [Prosopis cineraria]|uniref:myrcene synthase, chloroplastic-like n=1 Tax=Prosopis cineraria TaxID=364024 RepID=UPI0024104A6C|nr:myrcene synthase, chloroplastic-like [Prosopis cineraria]